MLRKLADKFLYSYQKISIQRVISLSFTVVSVLGMLFIGLSLSLRYSAVNQHNQSVASKQVLNQVNLSMDNYLRRLMRISDTVYYRILKNTDLSQELPVDSFSLLYEENRDLVVSIAVFDANGNLVIGYPLSVMKENIQPQKESWFSAALQKIENIHFSTPHVQNLFRWADGKYQWVVSLSRQVELTNRGTTQSGVLLVDMSFAGIEHIFRNARLTNEGYLYIVDSKGELIYHPQQQLIYAGLTQENNLYDAQLSDGTHWQTFQGERRQVTVKTVGYTGWKLIGVVPVKGITANGIQFLLFGLSVLLFAIFLLIFINIRISAHIAQPIRNLEKAVNEVVKKGNLPQIPQEGCYEVRQLEHTIRTMVSTMHHLMQDIITQEEDKRRSELDVLHAQINPHFLYNTLDSVVWLTESGRTEDAIQMVTSLGRLFRISLSRGKRIISIEEELQHADHYMTIQKIRYRNCFSFSITVSQNVQQLYTLKLLIQPILENAIYHGMASIDEDGEIAVKVCREGKDVYIDVSDNGLGMTEEIRQSLLDERIPYVGSKGSGIGVRNVHKRIQLTFGKEYGLQFFSEPDEGTTVRIHIPALEYPPEEQQERKQ